jgi:hypothetical protein
MIPEMVELQSSKMVRVQIPEIVEFQPSKINCLQVLEMLEDQSSIMVRVPKTLHKMVKVQDREMFEIQSPQIIMVTKKPLDSASFVGLIFW